MLEWKNYVLKKWLITGIIIFLRVRWTLRWTRLITTCAVITSVCPMSSPFVAISETSQHDCWECNEYNETDARCTIVCNFTRFFTIVWGTWNRCSRALINSEDKMKGKQNLENKNVYSIVENKHIKKRGIYYIL